MSLLYKTIKCGIPSQNMSVSLFVTEEKTLGIKTIVCNCDHPVATVVDRFNEMHRNKTLTVRNTNVMANMIFDILEIPKNQMMDEFCMMNDDVEIFLGDSEPVHRKLCSEPCCAIKTRRMCETCGKNNVCKTHGACAACKGIEMPVNESTSVLSPDDQEKVDRNRERARNVYRQKMGIPLDAPLIQRGGAHNVKYHTPEEKAKKQELDREYQKEYQRKYREKKMLEAKEKQEKQVSK